MEAAEERALAMRSLSLPPFEDLSGVESISTRQTALYGVTNRRIGISAIILGLETALKKFDDLGLKPNPRHYDIFGLQVCSRLYDQFYLLMDPKWMDQFSGRRGGKQRFD